MLSVLPGLLRGRSLRVLAVLSAGLPALSGCSTFWDDVTSRGYSKRLWNEPSKTLLGTDDPMTTARETQDGDMRARALARISEPKSSGGSDEQQQKALQILAEAATSDKQVLCRLAAIQTLSSYKDPKAVDILIKAYHRAKPTAQTPELALTSGGRTLPIDAVGFTPESSLNIQCKVLTALGKTANPMGLGLVLEAANKPVPRDASDSEKQQIIDLRATAIIVLGNYKKNVDATATLTRILREERDPLLRNVASTSYTSVTGQSVPKDLANIPPEPPVPLTAETPRTRPSGSPRPLADLD